MDIYLIVGGLLGIALGLLAYIKIVRPLNKWLDDKTLKLFNRVFDSRS